MKGLNNMIIGKCDNANQQELFNQSLFEYIYFYIERIIEQINCELDYEVYALFFDDDTYNKFGPNQPLFPVKWLEVLSLSLDESIIRSSIDFALNATMQDYQNKTYCDRKYFSDEFREKFFSTFAINLFSNSTAKDEEYFLTSIPLSSYKSKSEYADTLLGRVDDNCVIIVKYVAKKEIQLLRTIFKEHFGWFRGLPSSYIDSCIGKLFHSFCDGIYMKKLDDNHEIDVDNIIASAGKSFMWAISKLLGGDSDTSEITPNNHDIASSIHQKQMKEFSTNIEKISALAYERKEATGSFIFTTKDTILKLIQMDCLFISFETPYGINKHKLIRKLLETLSSDYYLLSSTSKVYGIIKRTKIDEITQENDINRFFIVNIKKGRVWAIYYAGKNENTLLLKSEYNNYMYEKSMVDYCKFEDAISTVFSISSEQVEPLKRIVEQALEQACGTMIVFSKRAEYEARRLSMCCIPLEKVNLSLCPNKEAIKFITSIDGAILCDEKGNCYAIGVILDGETSKEHEDISRGARYNSAHRYHSTRTEECVIVIISEDKYITVI